MDIFSNIIILVLLSSALAVYSLKGEGRASATQYSVASRNVGVFALTATLVMT